MIQPMISILIPHLRTPANDAALKVALDCIVANTGVDYELIIQADAERSDIYALFNDMAKRARAEWLVFSNSDVFFAPGWAEPMLPAADVGKIITGVLVEPGVIPVSGQNVEIDFGGTPETFERGEFEGWSNVGLSIFGAYSPAGDGWYMPCLIHREAFADMGGFDTTKGAFPAQLDVDFWQRWRARGRLVQRVRSFAYHLQAWSQRSRDA